MAPKKQPFVEALIGERIGGRYVVERVLGAGGMGVVAAGRYPELGQEVAIKFLRPELAANSILSARFLREARLAGRVKSPHFVRVFDLGKLDSGVPFLVMELLAGRDLGSEIDARGALPVEDAVDYVLQALVGIAEIHALGIIHRDLKPSNLFVSEAAGTRTIKVLDFGISKESGPVSSALTATDNLIGTPQYMSPEQVKESRTVDECSDVWSIGVILYELVTGALPFVAEGGAVGELFGMILFTDPVPPTKHRADLPPELEAIILKCLRRDRGERYRDVLALAEALRPFAPAGAAHRIEAVKQALKTTTPERLAERAARAAAPENADASEPQNAGDIVATVHVTTPEARRSRDDASAASTPATQISGPGAALPVSIATSMTSSKASIVPPPTEARPRPVVSIAILGAAVALAIGGVVFFGSAGVTPRSPAPRVTPTGLGTAPIVTASSTGLVPAAPAVAPTVVSTAPATGTPAASAVPSARASASASSPTHTPTRPPPAARPSAVPTPPADLLLDRK